MLWIARGVWVVLAFTSAATLDRALEAWSSGPRVAAGVLGWLMWAVALLALLAPRPLGFTMLRIAATAAVATAVATTVESPTSTWVPAVVVSLVAGVIVTSAPVAHACADGIAYGYERRFPLRAPFALIIGGIPLTALLVVIGATAGVLLLADARWLSGAIALVVGLPFSLLLARALHGLAIRWLIVVPAGFVIADPLSLADPVLVPSGTVASICDAPPTSPDGSADLRLGTAFGSLLITTESPAPIARRTGRAEATATATDAILVAPLRPSWFRRAFAERPRVRG